MLAVLWKDIKYKKYTANVEIWFWYYRQTSDIGRTLVGNDLGLTVILLYLF